MRSSAHSSSAAAAVAAGGDEVSHPHCSSESRRHDNAIILHRRRARRLMVDPCVCVFQKIVLPAEYLCMSEAAVTDTLEISNLAGFTVVHTFKP